MFHFVRIIRLKRGESIGVRREKWVEFTDLDTQEMKNE
jgi:hypothetical protein